MEKLKKAITEHPVKFFNFVKATLTTAVAVGLGLSDGHAEAAVGVTALLLIAFGAMTSMENEKVKELLDKAKEIILEDGGEDDG